MLRAISIEEGININILLLLLLKSNYKMPYSCFSAQAKCSQQAASVRSHSITIGTPAGHVVRCGHVFCHDGPLFLSTFSLALSLSPSLSLSSLSPLSLSLSLSPHTIQAHSQLTRLTSAATGGVISDPWLTRSSRWIFHETCYIYKEIYLKHFPLSPCLSLRVITPLGPVAS